MIHWLKHFKKHFQAKYINFFSFSTELFSIWKLFHFLNIRNISFFHQGVQKNWCFGTKFVLNNEASPFFKIQSNDFSNYLDKWKFLPITRLQNYKKILKIMTIYSFKWIDRVIDKEIYMPHCNLSSQRKITTDHINIVQFDYIFSVWKNKIPQP